MAIAALIETCKCNSVDQKAYLHTRRHRERIVVNGHPFSIDIFRLNADTTWTLEVVDQNNTSRVWD